jgi:hypothetical protein
MREVRVYKDNMREHIFRTLFLTDTVIFFGFGIFLAFGMIFFLRILLHMTNMSLTIASILLLEVIYALIATATIDHQPLFKLIPRIITYGFSTKIHTKQHLLKTTGDFTIIGDYVKRQQKLITILQIHPYDISLVNDDERNRYYSHMKTMLHTLPGSVQFLSQKRIAKSTDYHEHFFSLFSNEHKKNSWLLKTYIRELSDLIDNNTLQLMHYYIVLSAPLITDNDTAFTNAVNRLSNMEKRVGSALSLEQIQITQLTHKELVDYFQEQFHVL